MKKKLYILLLAVVALSATLCYGQEFNPWGPWQQLSCYKGIFIRVRFLNSVKEDNKWFYNVEFQNRYSKKVAFNHFVYNPATEKPKNVLPDYTFGDGRIYIEPGKIIRVFSGVVGAGNPMVQVFSVCFQFGKDGQPECSSHAFKGNASFAECDNGTPVYKVYTYTEDDDKSNPGGADDASEAETVKLKKQAEEKQQKFNSLITQGDEALKSRNYDGAINYYLQAQNMADNDAQKSQATQKYNQAYEAKRAAARATRVAGANERDKAENTAYTTVAGSAVGAMSLLKDGYTHRGFSGKFQLGLGYSQMPMVTNLKSDYVEASYADKASYPTIDFGLKFEMFNNAPVNLNVRGLYAVGLHAFETGVSGAHAVAGVDGGIQFWYKTTTKFKLFADVGWYQRTGDKKKDQDAANGGSTATDEVWEGKYNYQVMRFGFGPMLHFRNKGRESWIKPGVYFDKVSFAKEDKPALLFLLNININSSFIIEAGYGKNYPVAGTANYPNAFIADSQDHFSIKILKQGKLW